MLLAVSGHNSVWRNRGTPDLLGRPGTFSAWPLAPDGEPWCASQCSGLKQAVKPWGCAEDGEVQLHHLCAFSIQVSLMSLLESRGISGSQARDASPFLLFPYHHLPLSKSLFHPVSSAILYLSFKQSCHSLTPLLALWVASLPQNGVRLIPALKSREEGKS